MKKIQSFRDNIIRLKYQMHGNTSSLQNKKLIFDEPFQTDYWLVLT